jgi:hypothetical protein
MTARQATSGKIVNRMLHINENSTDLLYRLEAVRLEKEKVDVMTGFVMKYNRRKRERTIR